MSVDEKDRFLILVLTFFDVKQSERTTTPVAYKELAGFEVQMRPAHRLGFKGSGLNEVGGS